MSKIAYYLQEHLIGEVMTSTDARRYFATDGSIFSVPPALVVYPRNENDVRKTARFTWQLAERGRVIPMTARGSGTDTTGAALGSGITLVFPAHLNRILELDTKANTVTIEPGINYGKLQQTLHTHGRFLPPYPASLEYSTLGGALANNATGEKSVKYGDTRAFTKSLRVVLANGEVIETGRLSKRELNKKLGLATFEGEIYRSIDTLIEDNKETLKHLPRAVTLNAAGYNLLDVKHKDGSFDLTPLFIGSQGTLGIITEATLETEAYNPQVTVMLATFDSLEHLQAALNELRHGDLPSAIELIDKHLLEQAQVLNPNQLPEQVKPPFPAAALLIEVDDSSDRHHKKLVKKIQKLAEKYASSLTTAKEPEQQQQLWKIRQLSGAVSGHNEGQQRSVPLLDGAAVPPEQVEAYLRGVYGLFKIANIPVAIWGHAGDGVLTVQPKLNLSQVGDRQKAFRLMDEHTKLVVGLGGTISGAYNDGRLRAPYLEMQFGTEAFQLLAKVKQVFDPYGTLNPGVKFGSSLNDVKALIRPDYNLAHFYDHLPRS